MDEDVRFKAALDAHYQACLKLDTAVKRAEGLVGHSQYTFALQAAQIAANEELRLRAVLEQELKRITNFQEPLRRYVP